MRTAGIIAVAGALVLSQCSDRVRHNPLDPLNPETEGTPEAPSLSSDEKTVFVSWPDMKNNSITGYRVWRRIPGQSEPWPLATVRRPSLFFRDTVSHYDTAFTYQISALTETFESDLSPADSIIPGPFNYWVADFFRGSLSAVTYDGAHLLRDDYVDSPVALDLDPTGTFLWVASYYPGRITKLSLEGEEVVSYELGSFPSDMAVNGRTGDVWTVPIGSSHLIRLNVDTGTLEEIPLDATLPRDSKVDVEPSGNGVWVTMADSHYVIRISSEDLDEAKGFSVGGRPRDVITMVEPDVAWIATDSGLVGIDSQGNVNRYLDPFPIIDLDIHRGSQQVWLLAYDGQMRTTRVWTMTHWQGVWKADPVDIPSEYTPWKIKVNPGSSHPGIVIYDLVQQHLIRLDKLGNQLGKLAGFSPRLDIVIED
ncbi:MAG: hypothetical protein ACE5HZ_01395 [Fidelibacterota bacterium]